MKRFYKSAVIFLLLLQSFFSCATFAEEVKPIRIGVSLSLTGKYAEFGQPQQMAYRLWEEQVNQRGGILKRPVKVIIQDDKSDTETAIKIYQHFMDEEKIELIFGPYSSTITAAVAPWVEKRGYPMLAAGASSDEIWRKGYQYVFGVLTPSSRHMVGFFGLLSKTAIDRIAVVSIDDPFANAVAEGAKRWAPEYSLNIVDYRVLPKKEPDLLSAAQAARDAGAQILIMAGYFEESVAMRKILKKMGWTPKAFYASTGPTLQKYYDNLGVDAQGTFACTNWESKENLRLPGSADFLKSFRARYHETPSQHHALAYAAGEILEQAILKIGSVDRVALRQAMATMDINTIVGRYAVDRAGLQVKRLPLIIQWQGNKREVVWPEELRTADVVLNK